MKTVTVRDHRVSVVTVGKVGPTGSSALAATNVVHVSTAGDDATGLRNRQDLPFLTPPAAKAAALPGDTIVVLPGSYTCTATLAKDGVNWRCYPGVTITRSDATAGGIWDDGGEAMTFAVTGRGRFVREIPTAVTTGHYCAVRVTHADSDITVECLYVNVSGGPEELPGTPAVIAGGVVHTDGKLVFKFQNVVVNMTDGHHTGSGIYWENGDLFAVGDYINSFGSNYGVGVWGVTPAVPTGQMDVQVGRIDATGGCVYGSGVASDGAIWVRAGILKCTYNATSLIDQAVSNKGAGRVYVTAQKIFGRVYATNGGLTYVQTDKITAVTAGTTFFGNLVMVQGANTAARIWCKHYDPAGLGGESINVIAATASCDLHGGDYIGGATDKGCYVTAGKLRLAGGIRIDTSANNAASPVRLDSGTHDGLVLGDCQLIAEATRPSIDCSLSGVSSARRVVISDGFFANRPVHAGVRFVRQTLVATRRQPMQLGEEPPNAGSGKATANGGRLHFVPDMDAFWDLWTGDSGDSVIVRHAGTDFILTVRLPDLSTAAVLGPGHEARCFSDGTEWAVEVNPPRVAVTREALTGPTVLGPGSNGRRLHYDPDADWSVALWPAPGVGDSVAIKHVGGSQTITVTNDAMATLAVLAPDVSVSLVYDGTAWEVA